MKKNTFKFLFYNQYHDFPGQVQHLFLEVQEDPQLFFEEFYLLKIYCGINLPKLLIFQDYVLFYYFYF